MESFPWSAVEFNPTQERAISVDKLAREGTMFSKLNKTQSYFKRFLNPRKQGFKCIYYLFSAT